MLTSNEDGRGEWWAAPFQHVDGDCIHEWAHRQPQAKRRAVVDTPIGPQHDRNAAALFGRQLESPAALVRRRAWEPGQDGAAGFASYLLEGPQGFVFIAGREPG